MAQDHQQHQTCNFIANGLTFGVNGHWGNPVIDLSQSDGKHIINICNSDWSLFLKLPSFGESFRQAFAPTGHPEPVRETLINTLFPLSLY